MTNKPWSAKTALHQAVPFFHALPHLSEALLTTCGGQTALIQFDSSTCELVAYNSDYAVVARVPFVPTE